MAAPSIWAVRVKWDISAQNPWKIRWIRGSEMYDCWYSHPGLWWRYCRCSQVAWCGQKWVELNPEIWVVDNSAGHHEANHWSQWNMAQQWKETWVGTFNGCEQYTEVSYSSELTWKRLCPVSPQTALEAGEQWCPMELGSRGREAIQEVKNLISKTPILGPFYPLKSRIYCTKWFIQE